MDTRLNELRAQIGAIDREIVAALAQRSRLCGPNRTPPSPPAASAAAIDGDSFAARVQAEYAHVVAEKLLSRMTSADDEAACKAADCAIVEAVCRRMRVALDVARAKAAGQSPQFRALVAARDAAGLEQAITQPAVEEQVIARALTIARELSSSDLSANFPDTVAAIYREWIIPLARRVQVEALLAGK